MTGLKWPESGPRVQDWKVAIPALQNWFPGLKLSLLACSLASHCEVNLKITPGAEPTANQYLGWGLGRCNLGTASKHPVSCCCPERASSQQLQHHSESEIGKDKLLCGRREKRPEAITHVVSCEEKMHSLGSSEVRKTHRVLCRMLDVVGPKQHGKLLQKSLLEYSRTVVISVNMFG